MSTKKVMLFDLDDTLVVTYKIRRYALIEAGKRFYGLDISLEQVDEVYGLPWYDLLKKIYGEPESPEVMSQRFLTLLPKYPKEYQPGFQELISTMKAKSCITGIITASGTDLIESDMKSMNFPRESFDLIQSADDSKYHKPDGRVFDPALEFLQKKFKLTEDDVMYVGDSLSDKEAARDAGIDFVGVATGTTKREELEKGGTRVFESLLELKNVL